MIIKICQRNYLVTITYEIFKPKSAEIRAYFNSFQITMLLDRLSTFQRKKDLKKEGIEQCVLGSTSNQLLDPFTIQNPEGGTRVGFADFIETVVIESRWVKRRAK